MAVKINFSFFFLGGTNESSSLQHDGRPSHARLEIVMPWSNGKNPWHEHDEFGAYFIEVRSTMGTRDELIRKKAKSAGFTDSDVSYPVGV